MNRVMIPIILLGAVACAAVGLAQSGLSGKDAQAGHHVLVLPDQIDWKPGPPSLPPGAKFVILEGDPSKEGFFAMRAVMPDGYRIPPHWHPGVERITILSGTFHLGAGEKFDRAGAKAMPAGSYSSMQPGMRHFGWAEGETVIQVATNGPWGVTYVNPADDPRQKPQKK